MVGDALVVKMFPQGHQINTSASVVKYLYNFNVNK